jgi:hypothetical protein
MKPRDQRSVNSSLSIQAQLELNDIPTFANEPGPGHYFGEGSQGFSSMGEQKLAKCPTAPSVGFPHGWEKWQKVAITKMHGNAFRGRQSPGAVYHPQLPGCNDGLSTQFAKIGTSIRPGLEKQLGVDPNGSPGPTINIRNIPTREERADRYLPMRPLGKDKSFGKGSRFGQGSDLPEEEARKKEKSRPSGLGPGQYDRKDSALKLETGRTFGTGRQAYKKVITPGWEDIGQCRASPGVGPPLAQDPKHGSKACPFSTAQRFPKERGQDIPGPGMYKQNERDTSIVASKKEDDPLKERQGSVLSNAARPASTKFGVTLPKKPRFRLQLAGLTSQNACWGYF